MDGENNEEHPIKMGWFGGVFQTPPLFLVQHLYECWGFNQANQSPQKSQHPLSGFPVETWKPAGLSRWSMKSHHEFNGCFRFP